MNIDNLIKYFHEHTASADISSVLKEHIQTSDYAPYFEVDDIREKVLKNIRDNDDYKLIENSYKILKKNAFDIESHALIASSAKRISKASLSALHNNIATVLLNNILLNGDGTDYKTAFKIYYPHDEMTVFNFFKKYPSDRINHEKDGLCYDIYSFPDNSKLFFDISIPFLHISSKFSILDEQGSSETKISD